MPRPSDPNGCAESQLRLPQKTRQVGEQRAFTMIGEAELQEWVKELWLRYRGLLLEFANYHLRDRDRAQEVVQDTWVDVMKSAGRFEGRCSPRTWLIQILRLRLKKELRRTILRRAREAMLGIGEARRYDDLEAPESGREIWQDDPEKALLVQEQLEYVMRVSRILPGRQAEVWMLRDVLDWTSDEVSAALSITQKNQRTLLHRARRRLKVQIERHFGTPPKGPKASG